MQAARDTRHNKHQQHSQQCKNKANNSPHLELILIFIQKKEGTMSNAGGGGVSAEQLKARYVGTGHADLSK